MHAFSYCLVVAAAVSAATVPRTANTDVHLAVSPKCSTLSSGKVGDVNAGLARSLSQYKTIVALGDSYSAQNGAGLSNGPVWVEQLATAAGAQFFDYSASRAVVDSSVYVGAASSNVANATLDSTHQLNNLIADHHNFDPSTTLYTLFFGAEDFIASNQFTTLNYTIPATYLAWNSLQLISSPVSAKNILFVDNYGRGVTTSQGQAYKQILFTALNTFKTKYSPNIAFVDFSTIWNGVLGSSPGFSAFGYTSDGTCLDATTGAVCADAAHTFYYTAGNPTTATHKIMADYVTQVLATC